MKKLLPYFVFTALLLLLFVLFVQNISKPKKKFDDRVTLRQRDKIPYGTSVAKSLLPQLFPGAAILYDKNSPAYWADADAADSGQVLILVADFFDAEESELIRLLNFVRSGNHVVIITRSYSFETAKFFRFSSSFTFHPDDAVSDSLQLRLEPSLFHTRSVFTYPGKKYAHSFSSVDNDRTAVLGRDETGRPDFIQLKSGSGSFFIHTAPLAFSNYFVLHKNNVQYLQAVFSVLPQTAHTIVWNEFYLQRRQRGNSSPSWLGIMLKQDAFRWSFYLAVFTIMLYMLLNMRRRQRMIPAYETPKNESLDFIKTLGRLYYDRGDHKNIAVKMCTYFLDHVRTNYKLSTADLNSEFVEALHYKTGYPKAELHSVVATIRQIKHQPFVSEKELNDFYMQLELFYQNT